ncbi:MAG: DUF4367 domain-containing protein [Anaerovoracaceae bacterium]|jgi:hypothetical protein
MSEYKDIIKMRSDSFLTYIGKGVEDSMLSEFDEWDKNTDIKVPKETELQVLEMANSFQKKYNRKVIQKSIRRFGKVACLALIIIATVFTIAVVSVDALRIRVFDFLLQDEGEYRVVDSIETSTEDSHIKELVPDDWKNFFYPNYLPDGYKLVKTKGLENIKIIFFQNEGQDLITFSQELMDNNQLLVDNEDVDSSKILINGDNAFLTSKNGFTTIIWNHNQYQFMISGSLDHETLIKIAENLIFIK